MKKMLAFACFILCSYFSLAVPIKLKDAISKKLVTMTSKGTGGYNGECISISVNNISSLTQSLEIEPGYIFASQDSGAQNLMVVEEYTMAVSPNQTKTLKLYTMCIEHNDYSPAEGNIFVFSGKATGALAELANMIAKNNYHNSTSQSAVWAITDQSPLEDIFAMDTVMARNLAKLVSHSTGRPMPAVIPVKEHYIYSIRMDMVYHFSKPTKVSLICYDEDGKIVKEYYKNRIIYAGIYISTFGINRRDEKGKKFIFKLMDDKGNVLKERTVSESVNEPPTEKYKISLNFEYVLDKPVSRANMALYDEQGNLLEYLYTNRNLPAGGRRQAYSFYHVNGSASVFFIRLKDNVGTLIYEYKVDGSKSQKVPR